MKSTPIGFQDCYIKPIRDGRKTVTRRVLRLPWYLRHCCDKSKREITKGRYRGSYEITQCDECWSRGGIVYSKYGAPGDELWVRETFRLTRPFTGDLGHDLSTWITHYYADDHPRYRDQDKWRPWIHMPRWASRTDLVIISNRIERVQEITPEDVRREGFYIASDISANFGDQEANIYLCEQFSRVWNEMHGNPKLYKRPFPHYESFPWSGEYKQREHKGLPWYIYGNPWVERVEFKVKGASDE